MKKPTTRILLHMASEEFGISDLRAFARWIEDIGAERFVDVISDIRQAAGEKIRAHEESLQESLPVYSSNKVHESEITDRIERLLVHEAGVTKSFGSELLRKELKYFVEQPLPVLGRESFKSWIGRLLKVVPETELLHAAFKVRNKLVHGRKSDWPLKSEG